MTANNDPIGKFLGLSPLVPVARQEVLPPVQDATSTKAASDYEYARKNLKILIEDGTQALGDMIDFASQTQHPRAYEVVAGMIEKLVHANERLLNLSKQIKDIEGGSPGASGGGDTINNNLFVGSTAELQKFLADQKKNEE